MPGATAADGQLSYPILFGLILNMNRVRTAKSAIVAEGDWIARTVGPLPRAYFDALSLSPEEVDEWELRENLERDKAAALRRAREEAM